MVFWSEKKLFQVVKKRQRPVAENLASNSAAAAANNNFERKSAFSQSPHRLKFKLGLKEGGSPIFIYI